MSKILDYYFTPVSPWTYLGHARLVEMTRRTGTRVVVRPADLGRIFAATGGLPLKQRPPARQAYRMMELRRWRAHLGLPLNLEPRFFPANGEPSSLWIIAAQMAHGEQAALDLALACLRACWAEERDLADAATLAELAQRQGLDPAQLQAMEAAAREQYETNTGLALQAGVFGAPTYVLDGELFWGQDRLDFLERALAG